MRRSTRIDGSAGGEPLSCGNQSTYNRVANAGNLHRLSPFQMPFGILHNLTGKSSLTFSIEKCHFITVIVKGLLAGLITGITYRHYASKNRVFATFLAAFVCPIVNTGIFLAGCYAFFLDGIKEFAQSLGFAGSVNLFIFTVLIGGNFIFEVLFNIILCPTIIRIVDIGRKS